MPTHPNYVAALAILAILGALVPHAEADESSITLPTAVDPPNLPPGFDWASRLNQTHLVVDATPLYVLVDATSVVTPYIDLEITGLMPWRPYELTLGPIKRFIRTDGNARGVAWNVFAEPGVWTLLDGISREPVSVITIKGPSLTQPVITGGCGTIGGSCSGSGNYYTMQPPQPEYTDPAESGMILEQGAYSFTPTARIEVSNCWKHSMTVEAVASGGLAGGGNGGGARKTYSSENCVTIASVGKPREFRRSGQFQRDWYEDDSWRVYMVGQTQVFSSLEADIHIPVQDGETWTVDPGEPTIIERREARGMAVHVTARVRVYGIGLGVTIATQDGSASMIKVTLDPTERTTYRVLFVTGDGGATGLFAYVWRIQ